MSAEVGTTQAKQPFLHKGARPRALSPRHAASRKKLGGIDLGRTRLGIGGIDELMSAISVRGGGSFISLGGRTATMVAFVRVVTSKVVWMACRPAGP